MPFGLGIWEILILAGVLVLLFGSKGAPAMARRLGTGVRELKDAVSDMDPTSIFDAKDDSDKQQKPKAVQALEAPRTDASSAAADGSRVVDASPAVRVGAKPASASSRDDIPTADDGKRPS